MSQPENKPVPGVAKEPAKQEIAKQEPPKISLDTIVDRAIRHSKELTAHVMKFTGKHGYNPYTWLKKKEIPTMLEVLIEPQISEEVKRKTAEKMLGIGFEEPVMEQRKPLGLKDYLEKEKIKKESKK